MKGGGWQVVSFEDVTIGQSRIDPFFQRQYAERSSRSARNIAWLQRAGCAMSSCGDDADAMPCANVLGIAGWKELGQDDTRRAPHVQS